MNLCIAVDDFTVKTSITFAELSWNTVSNTSIDGYFYEIAVQECFSVNPDLLDDGYISYLNTTNGAIEVAGLESKTCYVFGIRMYSTRTGQPGEWTASVRSTIAKGTLLLYRVFSCGSELIL